MPRFALILLLVTAGCAGARNEPTSPNAEPRLSPSDLVFVAPSDAKNPIAPSRASGVRVLIVAEPRRNPEPASSRLAEARRLALGFNHEDALARVSEAQLLIERDARTPADFDAVFQCHVLRALIESNLGRSERARAALRAAAVLRPNAELDEVTYPPDLREQFAEIVRAARAEPPAALAITTEPSGAEVRLDGELVGVSPLSIHAISGRHYLRVDALAYTSRQLTLDLESRGARPLHVALPRADAVQTGAALVEIKPTELRNVSAGTRAELGRATSARAIARAENPSRPTADALLLLDLRSGAVEKLSLEALERRVAPPRKVEKKNVVESPWFWIVTGAAVVAAIVTYVIVSRKPDPVLRVDSKR